MVAQHEDLLVTQIANQPGFSSSLNASPHCDAVAAVQMEDALRVFTRRMDRTVDRESGDVVPAR